MHSNPDENELDKRKLAEIYEKYKNRMYISACRILKDPYLAEDAVHDAFVSISKNIDRIGAADSVRTASYVIKAAKNKAINMTRKNSGESLLLVNEDDARADEDTLEKICSQENYSSVVNAILSLEEKYRDVLSLYYLNELTVGEIAHTLSRKENTVKSQLARGRRKLINIIKEEADKNEKEYITSAGF